MLNKLLLKKQPKVIGDKQIAYVHVCERIFVYRELLFLSLYTLEKQYIDPSMCYCREIEKFS